MKYSKKVSLWNYDDVYFVLFEGKSFAIAFIILWLFRICSKVFFCVEYRLLLKMCALRLCWLLVQCQLNAGVYWFLNKSFLEIVKNVSIAISFV